MALLKAILYLPDQMDVIGHDYKSIHFYTSFFLQKQQAINDNLFEEVIFQQKLPVKYGSRKKLRMMIKIDFRHATKIGIFSMLVITPTWAGACIFVARIVTE
jgi:hypothetical protein